MSDDNRTETVDTDSDDSPVIRTLRQQLKEAQAAVKERDSALFGFALKDAGFSPDSGEGKAIIRTYQGPADPDAIRDFAKSEYGWEAKPATGGVVEDTSRQEAQARIDRLNAESQPVEPESIVDQIADAESKGDWQTAMALKVRALRQNAGA